MSNFEIVFKSPGAGTQPVAVKRGWYIVRPERGFEVEVAGPYPTEREAEIAIGTVTV